MVHLTKQSKVCTYPTSTPPARYPSHTPSLGVTAIIHVASPVDFSLQTWDAFYQPAHHGTIGMLSSALAHAGPQLSIVVLTSSIAAVSSPDKNKAGHHYTEADFNDWAEPLAQSATPPPGVFYTASKAASEKAFWKFREDKRPPFAMATVNPSVVTGPPINPPAQASGLNETLRPTWSLLSGAVAEIPPNIGTAGYVDVRDVAAVHVWCATHPSESAGHRLFTTAGRGTNQAVADILRKAYPDRAEGIPKGEPGSDYEADYGFLTGGPSYENEMARKAAGGEFIRYDQSIRDSAKVLERYL